MLEKEDRMGETEGYIGGVGGRALTRAEYEAWITETRRRGRRERIYRRLFQGAGIVAAIATLLGLLVWANRATAAPLREPDVRERGLTQPDAAPQRGVTLDQAKAACEQSGGHWLVEEDVPEMPGFKIIGCLFAVPKSMK
jgi:hypothetical protein